MPDNRYAAASAWTEPTTRGPLGDLVRSAREGDEEAWRRLHERFNSLLRGIVAGYRLRDADAADVIQATWSTCFEKLATLRDPDALPGWLSAICHHQAIRVMSARSRSLPMDFQSDNLARAMATPDDTTAHDALAALPENQPPTILHALLDDLDERDRSLMLAFTAEDWTYRTVASTLNMPIGSIGPTRQRIISRLRPKARNLELVSD